MQFTEESEEPEVVFNHPFFKAEDIQLQGYSFQKTIGKGQFGKVKLAIHNHSGEKVAVKIIDKSEIDEETVRLVHREIEIMKLLIHPNIIQLYEVAETEKYIFIVEEYASRGEIMDFIVAHGRLQEKVACKFFAQLVGAIGYMHSLNTCHRDLKASNLMLDENLNLKIVDFGLSNHFTPGQSLKTYCGSPSHASPELIQRKDYEGPEVDIWSMGVVLFNLVCGHLPFDGRTFAELFEKILKADYKVPDFISQECKDLLSLMLVVDASKRATVGEVALHPWLAKEAGYIQFNTTKEMDINNNNNDVDGELAAYTSSFGFSLDDVLTSVRERKFNHTHATYQLLRIKRSKMNVVQPPSPTTNVIKSRPLKKSHKRNKTVDTVITFDTSVSNQFTPATPPPVKSVSSPPLVSLEDQHSEGFDMLRRSLPVQQQHHLGHRRSRSMDPHADGIKVTTQQSPPSPRKMAIRELSKNHEDLSLHVKEEADNTIVVTSIDKQQQTDGYEPFSKPPPSPRQKSHISKLWKGFKTSFSHLLGNHNQTTPREKKAAFSTSTISSKSPIAIIEEMEEVLRNNEKISFRTHNFVIGCEMDDVIFELEVCKVPRLSHTYFLHCNRIKGNEWTYKNILQELLPQFKLE